MEQDGKPKGLEDYMDAVGAIMDEAAKNGIEMIVIGRELNPFITSAVYRTRRTCDWVLAMGMLYMALDDAQMENTIDDED